MKISTSIFEDGLYPHMPTYVHMPRDISRTAHLQHDVCGGVRIYILGNTSRWWPIFPILGFWGAKFPVIGDSLPKTPINHRAKFEAASFILAREIRNRTNKHTRKKKTNSKRYIHVMPIGMCG